MIKSLMILFSIAITSPFLLGQTIQFPDPNFKDFLLQGSWQAAGPRDIPFDADGNGDIDRAEAEAVTHMDCSQQGISNLEGIQYFKNLSNLDCGENRLNQFPQLTSLKKLARLHINGNQLTHLPPLPASLFLVYCQDNRISSLPQNIERLNYLNVSRNQFEALPPLPQSLIGLSCAGNRLKQLPTLPDLLWLSAGSNQLTQLPELPEGLNWLDCSDNQLQTLPQLPPKIDYLDCSQNFLTALPQPQQGYLQSLNCSGNQLTQLPKLPVALNYLTCSDNQLTSLGKLPHRLYELDCSNNRLTQIPDLTALANLRKFHGQGNQFDPQNCPEIHDLAHSQALDFQYEPQSDGSRLHCVLRGVIPWVLADEQWQSRISIFNGNNEAQTLMLRAVTPQGEYERLLQIPAESTFSEDADKLFEGLSGYALNLYGERNQVHASFHTINRQTPSRQQPSQANGILHDQIRDTLLFSYVPGDLSPALVLTAPFAMGPVVVQLEMFANNGILATTSLNLQGQLPLAELVTALFDIAELPPHVSIIARAPDGQRLTGTVFAFNHLLEPAMTQAIPLITQENHQGD